VAATIITIPSVTMGVMIIATVLVIMGIGIDKG
jgi:hypothetical protein